jgi:phage terminase Nu1 subunit (DNA packaging protein)
MKSLKLSLSELARLAQIDRRTAAKLVEGLKSEDGPKQSQLYYLGDVLERLCAGSRNSKKLIEQIQVEELRIRRAKAETSELDLSKLKGEVVSIEEVATTVEKEYNYIRARLRAVPISLAMQLSYVSTPNECQRLVHDAINEALTDLVADGNYNLSKEERMRQIDYATNGHDVMRIDENGRKAPHRPDLIEYREQLLAQNPDLVNNSEE